MSIPSCLQLLRLPKGTLGIGGGLGTGGKENGEQEDLVEVLLATGPWSSRTCSHRQLKVMASLWCLPLAWRKLGISDLLIFLCNCSVCSWGCLFFYIHSASSYL